MCSTAEPVLPPSALRFSNAYLRVISSNGREKKSSRVVFAMSHRIYWKRQRGDEEPSSLFDFSEHSSLELKRLPSDATWNSVLKKVKPINGVDGPAVIVPGRIHGRARWARFSGDVQIIITLDSEQERDKLMNELRVRIAPWEVLQRRAKEMMSSVAESVTVDEVTHRMEELLIGDVAHNFVGDLTTTESPSEKVK